MAATRSGSVALLTTFVHASQKLLLLVSSANLSTATDDTLKAERVSMETLLEMTHLTFEIMHVPLIADDASVSHFSAIYNDILRSIDHLLNVYGLEDDSSIPLESAGGPRDQLQFEIHSGSSCINQQELKTCDTNKDLSNEFGCKYKIKCEEQEVDDKASRPSRSVMPPFPLSTRMREPDTFHSKIPGILLQILTRAMQILHRLREIYSSRIVEMDNIPDPIDKRLRRWASVVPYVDIADDFTRVMRPPVVPSAPIVNAKTKKQKSDIDKVTIEASKKNANFFPEKLLNGSTISSKHNAPVGSLRPLSGRDNSVLPLDVLGPFLIAKEAAPGTCNAANIGTTQKEPYDSVLAADISNESLVVGAKHRELLHKVTIFRRDFVNLRAEMKRSKNNSKGSKQHKNSTNIAAIMAKSVSIESQKRNYKLGNPSVTIASYCKRGNTQVTPQELVFFRCRTVDPPKQLFIPLPPRNSRKMGHIRESLEGRTPQPASLPVLTFNADFQSANLCSAIRVGDTEYDLRVYSDWNSHKRDSGGVNYTQWFYFSVSGMVAGATYRFNIVNLSKWSSFFKKGMRPVHFSESRYHRNGTGWMRCGEELSYFINHWPNRCNKGKYFKTLSWCFTQTIMAQPSDTDYFAYCFPFTERQMRRELLALHETAKSYETNGPKNASGGILIETVLCHTLLGASTPLLHISDFTASSSEVAARPYVILSGRVHPGETPASYILHGVLDFLCSSAPEAKQLRNLFVFKVIPMLNIDGVVEGNKRTNILALDLNRQWIKSSPRDSPTVHHAKVLIRACHHSTSCEGVFLFCDFHAHDNASDAFFYGCSTKHGVKERLFPLLLSWISGINILNFDKCKFKTSETEGTHSQCARRAVQQLGIPRSYTLESTYAGASNPNVLEGHFSTCVNTLQIEKVF